MLREIVPETVKPLEVQFNVAIDEENVGKLQREIHLVNENTLVFDLRIISTVVNVFVDKFSSFPTLFGVVGVLVGAVVIANSVALSTLERRKDIAVLKSIGLKRQGVLAMIVAENAMLGIVGALFGVGFGVMAIEIYDWYDKEIDMTVNWWIVAAMAGLSLFVAIASALLASWDTSGEKPLNVLRYE
jgi:putative ABC transport system permease protein